MALVERLMGDQHLVRPGSLASASATVKTSMPDTCQRHHHRCSSMNCISQLT